MTLAATRLIPMRKNKGKSIGACLHNHTSYIQNPDKTEQGELVSSYQCSPLTVDEEFLLTKRLYEQTTGRRQKSDVIAYQVRQSFKPGEVTPEEANRIGYEFAERFLKGKHAFIVATHTDRAHIHNHIIYNSTALDGTRKFKNFWLSTFAVQRLSDLICLEPSSPPSSTSLIGNGRSASSIRPRRATVIACAESSTPSLQNGRRILKSFCKSWSSKTMR